MLRDLLHNNNTYYAFQNYTLTHANSEVNTLSPTLAPMTAHFDAINFQALTHLFPATDMGFEDFNSFLGIISASNIIRNQLSSFLTSIDDTDDKSITDPKVLINSPGAILKNVFLQMMSSNKAGSHRSRQRLRHRSAFYRYLVVTVT